jgi:hypothetical protein
MDEEVVEQWLESEWYVTILPQHNWQLCAMPESLSKLRREKYLTEQD